MARDLLAMFFVMPRHVVLSMSSRVFIPSNNRTPNLSTHQY